MATNLFTDIACKQETYKKERICGDTFLFRRMEGGAHSIAVLSDGMGHGVKANVLSSLTASMIINFDYRQDDIRETAEMILKSLPICSIRKISYSTFSIVDINHNTGKATIIEYDNPQSLIYRNGGLFEPAGDKIILKRAETNRDLIIRTTTFDIQENDRIVIMSDGITQSGLGSDLYPFGWGRKNVNQFILQTLSGDKQINSSDLAAKIMGRAINNEPELTHDDITCAVISIRKPKSVLMCSCPPSSESEYPKIVETIDNFQGEKIICGYHLALLISKLKGVEILKDEFSSDPDVQPAWHMQGVNIITESLVTMSKVYDILQKHDYFSGEIGPAATVCKMLLESDEINMLIGTSRENGGFYMVDEFELRRKVMKYIARILEQKYMKEVNILYV